MTDALKQPNDGEFLRMRRDLRREGAVVHVMGELDLVTAPQLADELTSVEGRNPPPEKLVVNLTGVTFLASAGLSVLLEHDQRCRQSGHELRVVAGNRTVARTIGLTGLTEVLTVRSNLAEAFAPAG